MKSPLSLTKARFFQIVLFSAMTLMSVIAKAQYEPQFTQYMNNEMFINPAYAGSRGFGAASILYRNQWAGMEGAPKTTTFNIHAPFRYEKVGLGLSILNDKIGVSNQTAAFVNYAYHMQVSEKGKLSLGLQAGVITVRERLLDVVTIDPNDPEFSNNVAHKLMPNFGFGAYYHTDKFYAGISIPRFLENKINPQTVKDSYNRLSAHNFHYYAYSAYVFKAGENVMCKPSVMIKAVSGAPIQADVNFNVIYKNAFWIGASYRTNAAIAFTGQYQFNKQLRFDYSYDYSLSKLNNYSSGTHEITVGYDFSFDKAKVVTPRYF